MPSAPNASNLVSRPSFHEGQVRRTGASRALVKSVCIPKMSSCPPVSPSPSTAAWLWLLWALQARLPCASLTVLRASTRLSTSDTPSRPCKVCDDVTLLWNVVSDQVLTSAFLSVSPAPALAAETQTDVAGSFSLLCSLCPLSCAASQPCVSPWHGVVLTSPSFPTQRAAAGGERTASGTQSPSKKRLSLKRKDRFPSAVGSRWGHLQRQRDLGRGLCGGDWDFKVRMQRGDG